MSSNITTLIEETRELAAERFKGKDFTQDWVTRKIPRWVRLLGHFRDRKVDVLEVGSFEGRSAVFLLSFLPQSKLTCLDLFTGPLEERFDFNLEEYGDRVEKIKGSAIAHLDAIRAEDRKFHLIYLDAGKKRDHVLTMSLLAWPLLREDGILIWDDYDWGADRAPEDRPHDAIDIFLAMHADDLDVIWKSGQVFVKKIKPGSRARSAGSVGELEPAEPATQDIR